MCFVYCVLCTVCVLCVYCVLCVVCVVGVCVGVHVCVGVLCVCMCAYLCMHVHVCVCDRCREKVCACVHATIKESLQNSLSETPAFEHGFFFFFLDHFL